MKYLVIAYDEKQQTDLYTERANLDLYDYLRNEFDNQGIVCGMVECESFQEIMGSATWLDRLYNEMMERAEG